jgi:uncharacterized protein (DUF305 family)
MSARPLAFIGAAALLALTAARMTAPLSVDPDGFDAGMAAATARMHAGMAVASSGDADRDFATMMIPHHQGAVDMAMLELRYGKNTVLKRLAQEIIVTQRQEIDVMQRAINGMPRPSAGAR